MKTWWYNPFNYIAGTKAFLLGLLLIVISTFIGSLNGSNFDGAFDVHLVSNIPFSFYFVESLMSWLITSILFYLGGVILSSSSIRFIDVVGTIGLSRSPLIISALIGFLPVATVLKNINPTNPNILNDIMPYIVQLVIYSIVSIAVIVWVVTLMVNAYRVSCNLSGAKFIISFILIIILSEIVIKILLTYIYTNVYHLSMLPGIK